MHFRAHLAVGALALASSFLSATPAAAGDLTSPLQVVQSSAVDTLSLRSYDLPAQSLANALDAFSQQSGLQVVFDRRMTANRKSNPVSGTVTAPEALRRLLAGSGIRARFTSERTVVLQSRGDAAVAAQTLEGVRVLAKASRRSGYDVAGSRTATKTITPLRDVPQSVTVVSRALMADQAMRGMADVVRYVPGVTMGQGEGNRDQPTIRGNATTADFFVDGVRDDVQYFRDVYNLERVEALKGSNAMTFGRGGGGGVLNRVTKEARFDPVHEISLQGGSYSDRRASMDLGQPLVPGIAARINGMYESSDLFRDGFTLRRSGINPTLLIAPRAKRTALAIGYEYFQDRRTADRGIPSFNGRPLDTRVSTFFGDPDLSYADITAQTATATLTHRRGSRLQLRNRTHYAFYDKFYQNVFPGAVTAAGDRVSISAYNTASPRRNLFNQTDVIYALSTGPVVHTLLAGVEIGRQSSTNYRETGFFNNSASSVSAPIADPTIATPLTFRQNATDADNRVTSTASSVYLQDQIALSSHWQFIGGLRYEHFDVSHVNYRTDSTTRRADQMLSPRAGLVYKPVDHVSVYGSLGVSFLPSAGDQFSGLTNVTKTLEPERFANYEIGAKWDVADRLAITTAAYRLNRTNTRATDPANPSRIVQTGSQRTKGVEVGLVGSVTSAWQVAGGYSNQTAVITSATTAAPAGANVPLVPRNTLSLWNRYQLTRAIGAGAGVVHRARMFAAIDNKVVLPAYTDVDVALFAKLGRSLRAQANVENIFNVRYYVSAHSNNNISPGSPRAVRVSLTTSF